MRDGKKSKAQTLVNNALKDLRRLTNNDPYKILIDAIELCSPMMTIRSGKKGSKVVYIPKPLNLRQRRRKAILWILEACKKRNEKAFPLRLSGEIQDIINKNSKILNKKDELHKMVLANRANINT
jgi:ribosomal protein S7